MLLSCWFMFAFIFFSFNNFIEIQLTHLKCTIQASLLVQWLRIHQKMQGTWVLSLVREDPTCCRAAEPMGHTTEAPALERVLCNRKGQLNEKRGRHNLRKSA